MRLNIREFTLIKDKIAQQFGLILKDEKKELIEEILEDRGEKKGLKDLKDYIELLINCPTNEKFKSEDELLSIASAISNKETYFFREMPQLELSMKLLSEILKIKDRLTILCLGCSSGEEVYTLSIMIHERGLRFPNRDIKIIGIDIDRASIKKAREGRYTENSFRTRDIPFEKYFQKEDRFYRIKDIYREITDFRHGNILDRNIFLGAVNIDMVFCRNVLIYMSDEAILKILENIHMSLSKDGYLLIGSAESITNKTDLFKPVYYNGIVVYKKN